MFNKTLAIDLILTLAAALLSWVGATYAPYLSQHAPAVGGLLGGITPVVLAWLTPFQSRYGPKHRA